MKILDLQSPRQISLSTIFAAVTNACEADARFPLTKPILIFADAKTAEVWELTMSLDELKKRVFGRIL